MAKMNSAESIRAKLVVITNSLREMYSKHILDTVPEEDKNTLFLKVRIDSNQLFNIELFNGSTNCIVIKRYHVVDLLKECSDIFRVNNMVQNDCKVMYSKSKEHKYKSNTIVEVV